MKQALGGALLGVGLAVAAGAEETNPPPFVDFSAKRIGVPVSGGAKRITVQIARVVPAAPAIAGGAAPEPASNAADWYWTQVSDRLADADAARLQFALAALDSEGNSITPPTLRDLAKISGEHGRAMMLSTAGRNVSPALALAVASIESGGRASAVSSAGARGLMQLMPETAERFGVIEIEDPSENIRGGVAYLDWLMDEFDRDPLLVLAAYNAGEGAVRSYDGVPPFAETRNYIPKVLAAWRVARSLCRTPPDLLTDPCIFVGIPNG